MLAEESALVFATRIRIDDEMTIPPVSTSIKKEMVDNTVAKGRGDDFAHDGVVDDESDAPRRSVIAPENAVAQGDEIFEDINFESMFVESAQFAEASAEIGAPKFLQEISRKVGHDREELSLAEVGAIKAAGETFDIDDWFEDAKDVLVMGEMELFEASHGVFDEGSVFEDLLKVGRGLMTVGIGIREIGDDDMIGGKNKLFTDGVAGKTIRHMLASKVHVMVELGNSMVEQGIGGFGENDVGDTLEILARAIAEFGNAFFAISGTEAEKVQFWRAKLIVEEDIESGELFDEIGSET